MEQHSLFDADPPARVKPSDDGFRQLRVLITVKAAPNPSALYGETVCVAGLSLDLDRPGWVRLYPINFRYLDDNRKFKKYDVVTIDAAPARNDSRTESWRPQMDTLAVDAWLRPWNRRRQWLDEQVVGSMCALNEAAQKESQAPSLGLVRPAMIEDLDVEPHPGWSADEQSKIDNYVNQLTLFGDEERSPLEAPRFRAFYRWRCLSKTCRGHRQGILDWELVALQRRLATRDDAAVVREIRRVFLNKICNTATKDVAFYVGNQAKRPQVFSILGVYYPPKVK